MADQKSTVICKVGGYMLIPYNTKEMINTYTHPFPANDKPREACGVFGIYAPGEDVAAATFMGLQTLQHRGQDAAGIAINNTNCGSIIVQKDEGLVSQVFADGATTLDAMQPDATIGIGHVRYGTSPALDKFRAAQPLLDERGVVALAQNGHEENIAELAASFGLLPEEYDSDGDGITQILGRLSAKYGDQVSVGMSELLPELTGAYSLVLTDGQQLIGARDPHGFRPLSIGILGDGASYTLASETVAHAAVGARFVRDVEPGEMVFIDGGGIRSQRIARQAAKTVCAFEFVYFARADGDIEGTSVHLARERMGQQLALESPVKADIVVGVPDSGIAAANGFSKASGIPFEPLGFNKNRYAAGRSFIQPTPAARKRAVREKLPPNAAAINGKRMVLVDDSIVRGTTMQTVVETLRNAGATEVHLRIPSPPYKWPCYYGMDTGNPAELLANKMDPHEMCDYLGVDSLKFISEAGLGAAIAMPLGSLCMACTNGKYPTPIS
jgi:amidophosphoribosyltransferase